MSRSLVDEQPPPVHNDHPACWDLVMDDLRSRAELGLLPDHIAVDAVTAALADMTERDQVGLGRYGTRLQPYNGRDSLIDAYQEALDLAVYLRTARYELETDHPMNDGPQTWGPLQGAYKNALETVVAIRTILWDRDGK